MQQAIFIDQYPLVDGPKARWIVELNQLIIDGNTEGLRLFHQEHPDVTMTEDALSPGRPEDDFGGYRVSGTSAFMSQNLSVNESIETINTLYDLGMINRDNEIIILANLRVYRYQHWPIIVCLMNSILARDDAVDIRVRYEDAHEDVDLARMLSFHVCTHYYGKPVPIVRRMYDRMMQLGFPNTRDVRRVYVHYDSASFHNNRPQPEYDAWLKFGDEDEDPSFLPRDTFDD